MNKHNVTNLNRNINQLDLIKTNNILGKTQITNYENYKHLFHLCLKGNFFTIQVLCIMYVLYLCSFMYGFSFVMVDILLQKNCGSLGQSICAMPARCTDKKAGDKTHPN